MSDKGTSAVIVGGGVTGLSAAWWLARSGVDVTVVEKGIVGFEASGRNGGGATHYQSPLFHEEQRLWPQMDELLGYPTEYRRERIIFQVDPRKERVPRGPRDASSRRLRLGRDRSEAGAPTGAARRRQCRLGRALPFRRPRQSRSERPRPMPGRRRTSAPRSCSIRR